MTEYLVDLERFFHGPMDLLLHLVREKEIEIDRLSLASVTDDYARYVESLRELDVNVASEYLVIAATLMLIKSRSLLPREEIDVEQDLGPDDELILQLIEYRRFREAAEDLNERAHAREELFERGGFDEIEEVEEVELQSASPWDLLSAFGRMLRERELERPHDVGTKGRTLKEHAVEIVEFLGAARGAASFREIIHARASNRLEFVGCFFAILELCRQGVVRVRQGRPFEEIHLELSVEDCEAALERVLFALEVQEQGNENGDKGRPDSDERTDGVPPERPAAPHRQGVLESEQIPAAGGRTIDKGNDDG